MKRQNERTEPRGVGTSGFFLRPGSPLKCVGGCVGEKSDRFEKEVPSGFRTSFGFDT